MSPTYLGLDLGTTSTKAAVVASDGTVLARSRVAHAPSFSAGRGRVDPRAWEESIEGACRTLGPQAREAAGLALAVQSPTVLLLDRHGRPTTAGVAWSHPAMVEECHEHAQAWDGDHRRSVGNRCAPATSMALAYHLLGRHEPEALASASTLGLVGTWLGAWLTGESAVDPTQAAYTGVLSTMDVEWTWISDLLDRLAIPEDVLPPVRPSLSVLGELTGPAASRLGIRSGMPVVVGCADTPAASFALGCHPGGAPLFIMGTTHVVSRSVGEPDVETAALQRPDVRPGRWLVNGVINGGEALALGARELGYGESPDAVRHLIEDAWLATPQEAADSPFFIPHVVAERGPLWLDAPRTALVGMTDTTSRRAAARGILEGVLLSDRMIIDSCTAPDPSELYLGGTHAFDPHIPQLIADLTGRRVCVAEETHLPSVGAALLCREVLEGTAQSVPTRPGVSPRASWSGLLEVRRRRFEAVWAATVQREPLRAATTARPDPSQEEVSPHAR